MKKLILAACLAAGCVATANAQQPRSILVYGDVDFVADRDASQYKTLNYNVSPGVGYQFNQNWTVGLSLSWGQNTSKDSAGNKSAYDSYRVGPFVRYSHYIMKSEIFFWFAQADVEYEGGYHTAGGDPANAKHDGVYAAATPALGINVGHGLALNFSVGGLGFATDKYHGNPDAPISVAANQNAANYVNDNNSHNTFLVSFGHTFNVGISKNFACHHKMMHAAGEPGDEVHHRRMDKMDDDDDVAPKPKRKERNRDEDE